MDISMEGDLSKAYKICNLGRDKRIGVTALSLDDLILKMREKLKSDDEKSDEKITVVLESDGTEVDEEEYFATLEPDTCLMCLKGAEKWSPNIPKSHRSEDETDDGSINNRETRYVNLVGQIKHNMCHISLLNEEDLELLSDMNPECVSDLILEKDNIMFMEQLKDASGRFRLEKQEAHDAMELLKLYHETMVKGLEK